jgi:hypothetical protein
MVEQQVGDECGGNADFLVRVLAVLTLNHEKSFFHDQHS